MPKFQAGDIVSIQGTVEDVLIKNDYEQVSIQWPDSRGYHDAKALTLVKRPDPYRLGSLWSDGTDELIYVGNNRFWCMAHKTDHALEDINRWDSYEAIVQVP